MMAGVKINYGAWFEVQDDDWRVVAKISEEELRRRIKLFFFETQDLEEAFNRLKVAMVDEVRRRVC
jgi:hypothetical protein